MRTTWETEQGQYAAKRLRADELMRAWETTRETETKTSTPTGVEWGGK